MQTINNAIEFCLNLPKVKSVIHHQKQSLSANSKLFLVHNEPENRICIRLSAFDQHAFATFNEKLIHAVPSKWGNYGWTLIYYSTIPQAFLLEMIQAAYCYVVPRKIALTIFSEDELSPFTLEQDTLERKNLKAIKNM